MSTIKNVILQYYQKFCYLSLDVVVGVFCNQVAITNVFNLQLNWIWYVVLPLAVWIIYLLDHVIDIKRNPGITGYSPIHFYIKQQHQFIIYLLAFLMVLITIVTWLYAPVKLVLTGFVMGMAVGTHLLIAAINPLKKSICNNKEFAVGIIYTTGIFIYPFLQVVNQNQINELFSAYALLLIAAFQNLLILSLIEFKNDTLTNSSSFIRFTGFAAGKYVFIGVTLSGLVFSLSIFTTQPYLNPLCVIYVVMIILNALLFKYRSYFMVNQAYRRYLELLFWLPIALFFYA